MNSTSPDLLIVPSDDYSVGGTLVGVIIAAFLFILIIVWCLCKSRKHKKPTALDLLHETQIKGLSELGLLDQEGNDSIPRCTKSTLPLLKNGKCGGRCCTEVGLPAAVVSNFGGLIRRNTDGESPRSSRPLLVEHDSTCSTPTNTTRISFSDPAHDNILTKQLANWTVGWSPMSECLSIPDGDIVIDDTPPGVLYVSSPPCCNNCQELNCEGLKRNVSFAACLCDTCNLSFCIACVLIKGKGRCRHSRLLLYANKCDGCSFPAVFNCPSCPLQFCVKCGPQHSKVNHGTLTQSALPSTELFNLSSFGVQCSGAKNPNGKYSCIRSKLLINK